MYFIFIYFLLIKTIECFILNTFFQKLPNVHKWHIGTYQLYSDRCGFCEFVIKGYINFLTIFFLIHNRRTSILKTV